MRRRELELENYESPKIISGRDELPTLPRLLRVYNEGIHDLDSD
jgi:hypothetical protein